MVRPILRSPETEIRSVFSGRAAESFVSGEVLRFMNRCAGMQCASNRPSIDRTARSRITTRHSTHFAAIRNPFRLRNCRHKWPEAVPPRRSSSTCQPVESYKWSVVMLPYEPKVSVAEPTTVT